MTDHSSAERPSDKFIPRYIVLFFVVQTVLFTWFVFVAQKSYTGLVTDQAYEKGLVYNKTIEKSRQQEALGFLSSVETKDKKVIFILRNKNGQGVRNADVTLTFFRPVHDGSDLTVSMLHGNDGKYFADVAPSEAGLWELRILAKTPEGSYQTSKRVVFK